jgi:hypothetical protein
MSGHHSGDHGDEHSGDERRLIVACGLISAFMVA